MWKNITSAAIRVCQRVRRCIRGSEEARFQRRAERKIRRMMMKEDVLRRVPEVVADVERALQETWPECEVKLYGSTASDKATRGSDVDVTLVVPADVGDDASLAVAVVAALRRHPDTFTDVRLPDTIATIVKCVHLPTRLPVDITFRKTMNVQNTALVKYFMTSDKRMFQMTILLKRWALRNCVKITQYFTNYNLVLLIIFYLQQEGILPPVCQLQKNVQPYFIGEWNAAFRTIKYHTNNRKSLYELLGGFFEYYSVFDYDRYVISVFAGYPVEREAFRDLDKLPAEFALYKHNVLNNISEPLDLNGDFIMLECFDFNHRAGKIFHLVQFQIATEVHNAVAVCMLWVLWCVARVDGGDEEFQHRADEAVSGLLMEQRLWRAVPLVVHDVRQTLRTIWPDVRVEPYGSTVSGIALRNSDVDITVLLPRAGDKTTILLQIKTILNQHPLLFHDVRNISNDHIKILKSVHKPTGLPIDLSLNKPMDVQNSKLIRYFMMTDRRAFQMAILVKRWAKLRMIKKRRVLTVYAVVLLMIFYLQQEAVLPPVSLLQKYAKPCYIDEWNMGFREMTYYTNNRKSLYELLGGFFEYYSVFDYDRYVISVFAGYPVEREAFRDLDKLPAEFALYKHNVLNNISEPLDLSRNFTLIQCFEFNQRAAQYLNKIEEFVYAAKVFRYDKSTNFLKVLTS